jgi:hypothetical protein
MRCTCCNKLLSDREATIKVKGTNRYTDTCDDCLKYMPEIKTTVRRDLKEKRHKEEDMSDDFTKDFWSQFDGDDS